MIFTAERSVLLDAVSKLQRIVGSKSSMPVLEGILISAEQGKVTMIAYNLEMGIKKEIYARTEEAGDIVINARLLGDILRRMNGIQVEISTDEKLMCHIKCEDSVFDIMGMAAIDFPEMPSAPEGKKINLEGKLLNEMVKGTLFAVSQIEGTRPILTGINVTVEDGVMQFVAIDGYRLAIRREKVAFEDYLNFIIAGKALGEVVKIINEDTEEVEISVAERLIMFKIDGYTFISRLLEGEFVNYQKTIPTEHRQVVEIKTSDIIDVIERVSLLINDSFSTPLRCLFNEDHMVLSCATAVGRATDTFLVTLDGEPFEIGLNSRYLLEALRAVDDDTVKILFNGANSGVIIRSANEENSDYVYMIMPMRLR
ncbi:MAG: DNA polymerase III subunit beta [Oscillospiraceae bacterium]|nr:DNA polymerase III subunit beta [Oscillospiraceae bacterium]